MGQSKRGVQPQPQALSVWPAPVMARAARDQLRRLICTLSRETLDENGHHCFVVAP